MQTWFDAQLDQKILHGNYYLILIDTFLFLVYSMKHATYQEKPKELHRDAEAEGERETCHSEAKVESIQELSFRLQILSK